MQSWIQCTKQKLEEKILDCIHVVRIDVRLTMLFIGLHEIVLKVFSSICNRFNYCNQPTSLEDWFQWLTQQVLEYVAVENGRVLYMKGDYSTRILSFITSVICRPFRHKNVVSITLKHVLVGGDNLPSTCRNMEWEFLGRKNTMENNINN